MHIVYYISYIVLYSGRVTKMEELDKEEPLSWLEWFLFCESAQKINTNSKKELFDVFDASKSQESIKAEMLKNDEIVFMYKQNFNKNKINFFHHLSLIGGSFYSRLEHYGAIQGIGEEVTSVVTPDMGQLLEISAVATPVPSIQDYMKVSTLADLRKIRPAKDSCYTARNIIPVPPFMLVKVNEAMLDFDGDSLEVLYAAIKVIKEFDAELDGDEELKTVTKAEDSCEDILHWLYLVTKGKINSTPTVGCSIREVRKHFKNLDKMVGLSKQDSSQKQINVDLPASIQKPLEIIAASSSTTQDFLSKLTQIQANSQDKSSNSFGKLSDKIQKIFLVASSQGSVVPTNLNEDASAFFKMQNFSKAQQYLESYLETEGIECSIPTAVANLWHQGCILWSNPITPSGLAASVISSKDLMFNDSIHEGILLDFSTKHEISKSSLTKLTKTQVMYPSSIELMIERLQAVLAITNLFFTENSYLSKGLNHLLTMCISNKTLLRTKLFLDKLFIAKFIFLVDDRINKWLSECGRVKTVDETSIELVDFATIIIDIKLNRFFCDLPHSIKVIAKDEEDSTTNENINGKKRKHRDNFSAQIVVNENLDSRWKLTNDETWPMWRHKTGKGPTLSCNSKPCLKFHVRGSCFDDYTNKASHKILNDEDKKKTDEFIRQVRNSFK